VWSVRLHQSECRKRTCRNGIHRCNTSQGSSGHQWIALPHWSKHATALAQTKQADLQKTPPAIIAKSPMMQKILQSIEVIAPTLATVLIQGQTGVVRSWLHEPYMRWAIAARSHLFPLTAVQFLKAWSRAPCSDMKKALLPGHRSASRLFWKSWRRHPLPGWSRFIVASCTNPLASRDSGRRAGRVGGKQTLPVDLRIISATNQNLEDLVKQGLFRHDLYYRINVIRLSIPTLAERPEDFPYLVQLIIQRLNKKYNKAVESVSREVMRKIRAYPCLAMSASWKISLNAVFCLPTAKRWPSWI